LTTLEELKFQTELIYYLTFTKLQTVILKVLKIFLKFFQDELEKLGVGIIGTTRRGIGPCYSTKALRCGLRVGDLLHWNTFEQKFRRLVAMLARGIPEEVYGGEKYIQEELTKYHEYSKLLIKENFIIDSVEFIHSALASNKKVLIEGANATMLDIDFGTYPFVTSSNPSMGGASTGLGVPPTLVGESHGVMKAYTTRVGAGPFPTEDFSSAGELMVRRNFFNF
jgi:adenylosuccinate synthase